METIIVTRHPALVEYLFEQGIAPAGTRVLAHVSPDDVRGKRVVGLLPLHLAAEAASVVEVPLDLPAELRGVELTIEQVRALARPAVEYHVTRSCGAERSALWTSVYAAAYVDHAVSFHAGTAAASAAARLMANEACEEVAARTQDIARELAELEGEYNEMANGKTSAFRRLRALLGLA